MKYYQNTEAGQIYTFDNKINAQDIGNRNIPKTLSDKVFFKPDDSHVWYQ
ncbi:hypothetical protein [Salinivibrio sp. KP-1]|nr:hypothetical protein [Salinivibrio sp. KP-1]